MKWAPWKTFKKELNVLDIKEPPCKSCKYWKPQSEYRLTPEIGVEFDGVVCCNSKNMYHDFSCFKERV